MASDLLSIPRETVRKKWLGGVLITLLSLLFLAGSFSLMMPAAAGAEMSTMAEDEVVLTITGSGVEKEVEFTRDDLVGMKPYQQVVYTAINTWPTKKWYVGEGVKLNDLLDKAGLKSGVKENGLVKFIARDGFHMTFTAQQLLQDERYIFPNFKEGGGDADGHVPGSTLGQKPVDTIIGLVSAEGTANSRYMNDLNAPLLMLGQRAVTEQNGQSFVKNVRTIEVLDEFPSQWEEPTANLPSGEVPVGTLVELSSTYNDDDKVHYTIDKSTPTIESPMYNWIASRWWSSRGEDVEKINHPIEITEDTTIKAIVIGPGKRDSEVVTFEYTVPLAPELVADTTNNTVGQAVYLTFTDDGDWWSSISDIAVDGTSIRGRYTVGADKITIDSGVLTKAKNYTITVKAANYSDATVTQMMIKPITEVTEEPITVEEDNKNLAITKDTLQVTEPINISVPEKVKEATINVKQVLTEEDPASKQIQTKPLPELKIETKTAAGEKSVEVNIPAKTVISVPREHQWDGAIKVPQMLIEEEAKKAEENVIRDSGKTIKEVTAVVEVGAGDIPLSFSQAVRLVIPGQAGKDAGWIREGKFTPITMTIEDNQDEANSKIPHDGDARIDVDEDLVIWTKHFTKFVAYESQGEGTGDKEDPDEDDGEVVLTVTGSGVAREVDFTRADLDEMKPYELTYTAINTWPTKKWYVGKGVKLNDLLNEAGVKNAGLIKFTATDGFTMTFTGKQLLRDTRYRFPNFKDGESDADGHLIGSTAGQTPVDTIIGLVSAEGTDDSSYMNALNAPLLMLGQRAVTEQNGQSFVKNVRTIEVLDASPSQWAEPTATADEEPDEEGKFPAGTLVELSSTFNDDDKVHYTTDNSNPTIESPIYNWIASRWWSTRGEDTVKKINKPIELTQDTVIKARTIGPGKEDSAVATFSYKVKEAPPGSSEKFFPSQGGKVKHEDKVEVDIPPNAIQETDEVEVKIQPLVIYPDLPADFKLASEVYQFSVGDDKNYSFAREVTIKFSLGPEIVNENAAPAIHYYDEDQEQWVNIGGTVSDGTITIEVDHFGKFAVMVEKMMELEEPEEPEEPDMAIKLTDIKDHWARKNIERLVVSEVVTGYPDGTFKPNNTITRAEFTVMLVKAFNLKISSFMSFDDTVDHWAKDFISTAVVFGIANGYDDYTFGPNDPITREQMALMIVKAAGLTGDGEETSYLDQKDIAAWARPAVAIAARDGIMKGYPDNTFRPRGRATRAEAVTVIVNSLDTVNKQLEE